MGNTIGAMRTPGANGRKILPCYFYSLADPQVATTDHQLDCQLRLEFAFGFRPQVQLTESPQAPRAGHDFEPRTDLNQPAGGLPVLTANCAANARL